MVIKKKYKGATIHTPKLGTVVVDDINLKAAKYYANNGLDYIFESKSDNKKKKTK